MGQRNCTLIKPPALANGEEQKIINNLIGDDTTKLEVWMGDNYWAYTEESNKTIKNLSAFGLYSFDGQVVEPETGKMWAAEITIELCRDGLFQQPSRKIRQVPTEKSSEEYRIKFLEQEFPTIGSLGQRLHNSPNHKFENWIEVALWVLLGKPNHDQYPSRLKKIIRHDHLYSFESIERSLIEFEEKIKEEPFSFYESLYMDDKNCYHTYEKRNRDYIIEMWKLFFNDWEFVDELCRRTQMYQNFLTHAVWNNAYKLRHGEKLDYCAPPWMIDFQAEINKKKEESEDLNSTCETIPKPEESFDKLIVPLNHIRGSSYNFFQMLQCCLASPNNSLENETILFARTHSEETICHNLEDSLPTVHDCLPSGISQIGNRSLSQSISFNESFYSENSWATNSGISFTTSLPFRPYALESMTKDPIPSIVIP